MDMEVSAGDVLAVVGANGSGKSTLLRILVGLSHPTSGAVSGRPRHIGYVPDRFTAHDRISAVSYLTHMGRIRGLSVPAARARSHHLLERLSLVGGRNSPLRTLSKGNAQKVALAQALLIRPELLVLDEPWSGLDASAHGVLAEFIDEVVMQGGAVVFTDHGEASTETRADAIYAISEGGRVTRRAARHGGPHAGGHGDVHGDPYAGGHGDVHNDPHAGRHGDVHTDPHAAEERTPMVELVLTVPSAGAVPLEVNWPTLPGVVGSARRDGAVVLRVAREHSDAVLLTALRHRWSVEGLTGATEERGSRAEAGRAAP
ncbi:ATP-binding cassette domain-containing protein [Streptomyces sp. cmx-18-6]|uniref:ATP-binding cassette domain-containing protein n=1 Tax=Streptomyces sp. cmx-18-6 TaxID=2790930 RepID=UPI0039808DD7